MILRRPPTPSSTQPAKGILHVVAFASITKTLSSSIRTKPTCVSQLRVASPTATDRRDGLVLNTMSRSRKSGRRDISTHAHFSHSAKTAGKATKNKTAAQKRFRRRILRCTSFCASAAITVRRRSIVRLDFFDRQIGGDRLRIKHFHQTRFGPRETRRAQRA